MTHIFESTTMTVQGLTFRVDICQDTDSAPPWKECDGYGIVRQTRSDDLKKAPGERVLYKGDRHEYSYIYDWAGTIKLATKDRWGPRDDATLTERQQIAAAVQKDFAFLHAWCTQTWVWCGVQVTRIEDGEDGEDTSLWSIEYWQYKSLSAPENEYLLEVAHELATELADAELQEQTERAYWEARGGVTT